MALRLANKINRHIFQSFARRPMSVGPPVTEATAERSQKAEELAELAVGDNSAQAYQVCRPRSSSLERSMALANMNNDVEQLSQVSQKKQLQPSHLPEYYRSVHETNYGDESVTPNTANATYKEISASKTFTSVTLPLKGVKLAKPFPDPVKMMPSHTISDAEKAQQMYSESRTPIQVTEKREMPLAAFMQPHRKYSTGSGGGGKKKCPKAVSKCKKLLMDNCEAATTANCKRPYKFSPCEKKEAPYPSFSEACYEEYYEKPSECKLCPWRPEDNPHFKPSKKHYHTEIMEAAKKVRDCPQPPAAKEPCGWVEEDKKLFAKKSKNKSSSSKKPPKKALTTAAVPAVAAVGALPPAEFLDVDELNQCQGLNNFLDLASAPKKDCPRPEGECEKRKRLEQAEKDKKKDPCKKKKASGRIQSAVSHWLNFLQPSQHAVFLSSSNDLQCNADNSKGPCKKFPFKKQDYQPLREKAPKKNNPCNKKKLQIKIVDCPGKKDDDCNAQSNVVEAPISISGFDQLENDIAMIMKEKDCEKPKSKKNKKCPKFDNSSCKDEKKPEPPKDIKSRVCPDDLVPRKGKKNKKPYNKTCSSLIATPPEPAEPDKLQKIRQKCSSLSRFYN